MEKSHSINCTVSNYAADVLTGDIPLTVNFTDQSTGSITSWTWNFGNGTTSNDQNPVHTYTEPGNYTVTLTATGPGGTDIETKDGYIVVSEASDSVNAMPWLYRLLMDSDE